MQFDLFATITAALNPNTTTTVIEMMFVVEDDGEILAVYMPQRKPRKGDILKCYSHAGQHSSAQFEYIKTLPAATPEQYEELKTELSKMYGIECRASE
jgi:hypothetical protein